MGHLTKLANENMDTVSEMIPASLKGAVHNQQHHKIAEAKTGMKDFSFAKIAEYFGGRIAARKAKWRPVHDGLQALRNLRG
jgi:hypothetical protein